MPNAITVTLNRQEKADFLVEFEKKFIFSTSCCKDESFVPLAWNTVSISASYLMECELRHRLKRMPCFTDPFSALHMGNGSTGTGYALNHSQ